MPLARCVRAVGFPRTAPSPPKPHHNMLRFLACSVLVCVFVSCFVESSFRDIRDKTADALSESPVSHVRRQGCVAHANKRGTTARKCGCIFRVNQLKAGTKGCNQGQPTRGRWSQSKQRFHCRESRPMRVLLNHSVQYSVCTVYAVNISGGSYGTTKALFEIETAGHSDRRTVTDELLQKISRRPPPRVGVTARPLAW